MPHEHIEALMSAADLFVSGSHREGSGFAVIEALACGLVPVITNIPSFRALTANGTVGRLWRPGNATDLADSLQQQWSARHPRQRSDVRAFFDGHLSSSAVGAAWVRAYAELLQERAHP
jgi:glycosyltransferase involved in cell wall biosynthesis